MSQEKGGVLIEFDEERRAGLLHEVVESKGTFSDALSSSDWGLGEWEVCGLLFDHGTISYWGLAHRTRKVATGKVRVEFRDLSPTNLSLGDVEQRIGSHLKLNLAKARAGGGGRVPPATWKAFKEVLRAFHAQDFQAVARLERLRDQSGHLVGLPGAEVVAQERDAVGLSMDIFDSATQLRKEALTSWAPPAGELRSFLDGLQGSRLLEGQQIAADSTRFDGATALRHTSLGAVFSVGNRQLEVFNVDRTTVERTVGVDLLYRHDEFDAWTLVQYKSMEPDPGETGSWPPPAVYRPDRGFRRELKRMEAFRRRIPDVWDPSLGPSTYRISGDGFYFKLCSRLQLEVRSPDLLPGMYLPREFVRAALQSPEFHGERGGTVFSSKNVKRQVSNTLFTSLVRDGWIGTRGISSAEIRRVFKNSLSHGRAVVVARGRVKGDLARLGETSKELGLP